MTESIKLTELDRPLRRNEQATVSIESLTHEGRGVSRVGGKVLFVADALPGEIVDATVIRRKRGHDEARLDTIHKVAAERTEPRCQWFGICGGCSLQHLQPQSQLELKQQWLLDTLQRIGHVEPATVLPPLAGPFWGYRRRARLGVKFVDRKERVLVGFRERHKPYITDMKGCEVLIPAAAALIEPLQELIAQLSISRRLPQIEVAGGDEGLVLVMRVLDEPEPADIVLLESFATRHQLVIALQRGRPEDAVSLDGSTPMLHYTLPKHDIRFTFAPTDFVQINEEINASMIDAIVAHLRLGPEDDVLDLFCGLGNITLPLARHAASVTGIEGAEPQVNRARENAAANGLTNVEFAVADLNTDVAQMPFMQRQWDRLVLDPPRSGAAEICTHIDKIRPQRIVYVSCHPATLARDAETLCAADYRLESAGVMDMFPHTAHVESMAVFVRNS